MEEINYTPLFILFIIAWIVPLSLSWLRVTKVPAVIVEIMMGVLIGPYALGLITDAPYLDFLAQTGFLFLIFLAGLEIDVLKILSSLPRNRIKMVDWISNSFLLAIFIYFGSLALSLPFAWLISQFIEIDIVFFTMLLPAVALSITVPILKADGELNRKFGQIMLMEGAIATVMSIILISVYSGVLKNGFQVELLLFTVIFFAFVIIYIIGKQLIKIKRFQYILYALEHAASQIRIRGTIALVLFFVIIAHWIKTELVMGAFFAGLLLSIFISKERSALIFKLDGMAYGFFIPIFFIMVGVNLDLSALKQFQDSIPFIFAIVIGYYFIQVGPSLILYKVFGFKKALAGGILLTTRMGIAIAAAQIGLSLGVINSADNAGIVTASIMVSLISPLAYKFLSHSEEKHHHIYILGGSKTSLLLAERFRMHGTSCLTLLQNTAMAAEFEQKSLNFQLVPKLNEAVLDKLHLRASETVIVLTESKNLNNSLTDYIKNTLGHRKIITKKNSISRNLWVANDAMILVDHNEVLTNHIEELVLRPDAVTSLSNSFGVYRIEEIQVSNKAVHHKMVKEIAFPPSGSLVVHRRSGEVFIPHGNTHLLIGDIITVIGNQEALIKFRNILEHP